MLRALFVMSRLIAQLQRRLTNATLSSLWSLRQRGIVRIIWP
jgi:hypothetical protein